MGVASHARRDPDQHLLPATALQNGRGDLLQPSELVQRVDHDVADAGGQRLADLV